MPKCTSVAAPASPIRDNARMHIFLNGEAITVPGVATVAQLLVDRGLAERRVAVEVNGAIVPRSAHATCTLGDNDQVEIVHALGGG
jgi:sulfur carrier protein